MPCGLSAQSVSALHDTPASKGLVQDGAGRGSRLGQVSTARRRTVPPAHVS
jgi:hypothetical protein